MPGWLLGDGRLRRPYAPATSMDRSSQIGQPVRDFGDGRAGRPLRFAVVGLGYIAQTAVLPAFAHATRACELTALVSGDAAKLRTLSRRYRVPLTLGYEAFDEAAANGMFDAVYIALPNHLHRSFTVRAAQAGKHVLCEKPMAPSVSDCDTMIAAARENDVRLMVAYRLHLDPVNLHVMKLARSGRLGELHAFESSFATPVRAGDIRTLRATAGGTLWDIGIYCINACRHLFRAEPTEVFCWTSDGPGRAPFEVEAMTTAVMRFPEGRLARFWTSFRSGDVSAYAVMGSKGHLRVDNAYEYHEPRRTTLVVNGKTTTKRFGIHDQFAAELDYFTDCVRRGVEPVPSGIEGRTDVAIIRALYESARSGQPVDVSESGPARRPEPSMAIARPPVRGKPQLVHARAPHPA